MALLFTPSTSRRRLAPAAFGVATLALALGLSACSKENDDAEKVATKSESAAVTPQAALDGAAWLEGQLVDGVLVNDQYKTDDYSTTVELGYALRAIDPDSDALEPITAALVKGVDEYASPGKDVYAGATAKLASYASDAQKDPRSFGGEDLIAQLEERTADEGPSAGRISDVSEYGDYANGFGQAWAVRALTLAGSDEAGAARDYLLGQQCDAGYIRLYFPKPKDEQPCTGEAPQEPVDTTALAYVLLHDLAGNDENISNALDKGMAYILDQQADDGSFSGGSETPVPNANSTGLAGWALQLAGEDEAAAKAATWVRAHQIEDCEAPLAKSAGAIGFDDQAVKSSAQRGITKKTAYQWRLASVQALPALLATPEGAPAASCPE
ncbi:MAG: terpene cyclase/mutase family protein [Nocardioidaceae bacterium]|nr:terpene cyclase/mutase family protein [Nocardioidaceae bacterium]